MRQSPWHAAFRHRLLKTGLNSNSASRLVFPFSENATVFKYLQLKRSPTVVPLRQLGDKREKILCGFSRACQRDLCLPLAGAAAGLIQNHHRVLASHRDPAKGRCGEIPLASPALWGFGVRLAVDKERKSV
jgi:hypothetical protein